MQDTGKEQTKLSRILVVDRGVKEDKKGNLCHRMNFAYACDQMEIGKDVPVAHPYLHSLRTGKDGKVYRNRDYYLSDTLYRRLMRQVSSAGCENSKYTGIVEAQVQQKCQNGTNKMILNLAKDALPKGLLRKSEIPFDEKKHVRFVKASQAE